ncbi:DUF488 family protein [Pseudomaricurvus sp. HS19]|uniref:DUF488 domain-containing protein n=1 Tax=Pseudomaricurvus sp. HS19 TaxID=2692626 RepID=UPI00136E4BBE|nr:DUF488 domain-containing protein [Pseudomaricurvus sp. HS19]MYM62457.1 DUF488 family protein [Pseudomaricurvus sp. HS19]
MLYTIGYATKSVDVFLRQLLQYGISAVADVRSVPFSKAFFDYHQPAIRQHLENAGIRYVYLGDELGPRSKNPDHYDDCGQVQFDRLSQSELFRQGVERLQDGMGKGFHIALMCAEKDAASCHRSLLIGYAMQRQTGLELQHITHDGELETQQQLEARLPLMHQLEQDLFLSREEALQRAYRMQLQKTSYRKPRDDDGRP